MLRSLTTRRIVGVFYLGLVAFTVAHAANAFVANALYVPLEPAERTSPEPASSDTDAPTTAQQSADEILRSGLFELPPTRRAAIDGGPAAAPPPPPIEAARKVALLGSVIGKDGGGMAVLEDLATKKQDLYRLGAEVPNVGTLATVEKNRVLFRSGPSEEWLPLAVAHQMQSGAQSTVPLQPAHSTPTAAPARRVLDRREVTAALNDPTRLMTQAQAVPYLSDGKLDGFRLYNVVPAGFFDKIGLQTNDIVQRINGVELRDPGMLLSLFQQLRNERTVRVDMVRSTQRQTLVYDIR